MSCSKRQFLAPALNFGLAMSLLTLCETAHASNFKVLYDFQGGTDGSRPWAGLTLASDGNLYGTTSSGGTGNVGTVFKLSPDGTESVISDFAGTDVGSPDTDLLADQRLDLYGTAIGEAYGTVFELTPRDKTFVLHSFSSRSDGSI